MYALYTFILSLGLLALSPLLLLKDTQDGRYTRYLGERFGWLPPLRGNGAIWIHAVSVGEALAVERLLASLRERFPRRPIVLSVTTAAGRAVAERRIGADRIFYFPLDLPFAVRRTLAAIRPTLILIVETEIWPNFLREATQRGAQVVFINGRISGRSFARYRLVRRLLRRTLAAPRCFLMQTARDAERILDLGAPAERVRIAGNLKFDLVPPANQTAVKLVHDACTRAGILHSLVAGSTMEAEEELVLDAYEQVRAQVPYLLLILAPRHPQRFAAVHALVQRRGLPVVRRTCLDSATPTPGGVLLLDTVGELAALYQLAAAAFVGGSLVPHGGHNILEPAYFGTPVVFGPYMHNFAQIAEQFLEAHAALRADSSRELAHLWIKLLKDRSLRARLSEAAQALLESQRGATACALGAIEQVLDPGAAGTSGTGASGIGGGDALG